MALISTLIELIRVPFSGLPPSVVIGTFWLALIAVLLFQYFTIQRNNIPGPRGIPVFGYLPFLGKNPQKTFLKLRKEYGDVFSIQMGSFPAIVLNGKDVITEALMSVGDDFSGRPHFYTSSLFDNGESLTFGTFGPGRLVQKQIAGGILHMYNNARQNPLKDLVEEEVNRMCIEFDNMNGVPFNPNDILHMSIGSILYQLCYGRHEDIRDDKSFCEFIAASSQFTGFTGAGNPIDVMPWLRFIMPWKFINYVNAVDKLTKVIKNKVKEEEETYSSDYERHLTDGFIKAANDVSSFPEYGLTGDHIKNIISDITFAGFETLSTTLAWTFLYMAANPDIQQKVQAEIDEVIGARPVRQDDKDELHYTMATITEIMRISNVVPLAIPHAAFRETKLKGYEIRKGTVVIPNLYSITHDELTWGDPDTFRPERFLHEEGHLDKTKTDMFTVFSMGRRKCLGETLAEMELFLFITAIFQKCIVMKPESVDAYSFEGSFGLTVKPEPYEVCVMIRS